MTPKNSSKKGPTFTRKKRGRLLGHKREKSQKSTKERKGQL